jgi:hypothetical protein
MVVAILTVKMKKVTGLFFSGPGWVRLDHLLSTRVRRSGR